MNKSHLLIYAKCTRKIFVLLKYIPIYLIHAIAGKSTHLYILMPLLGLIAALKRKKIPSLLIPVIFMYLIAFLTGIFNFDTYVIKRSFIMMLIPLFALFLSEFYTREELLKLMIGTLLLCFIYFILNYSAQVHVKQVYFGIFSFPMARIDGLQGYSNHTGLTLATIGCFFLIQNQPFLYFMSWIGVILTASRGSMVIGLLFLFLFLFRNKNKVLLLLNKIIFSLIISSPLIFLAIERFCSNYFKLILNSLSSGRYILQLASMKAFLDFPFGVGTDSSQKLFYKYILKSSTIVSEGFYVVPDMGPQSAHSTFINILIEQGIVGFALFTLFIIFLFNKVNKAPLLSALFVTHLFGHTTLNGISEFSFWLIVAYILNLSKGSFQYDSHSI